MKEIIGTILGTGIAIAVILLGAFLIRASWRVVFGGKYYPGNQPEIGFIFGIPFVFIGITILNLIY